VIDGRFGVVNIFVHDKSRAACVLILIAQTDLVHRPVLAKNRVQVFGADIERQIAHVQDPVDFGREFGLLVVPSKQQRKQATAQR
jgi:hypothetical protein